MQLTQELRTALLDGSAYGFPSATSAPKHFQDRIIEVRHAQTEKRAEPQPSAAYQQRSLAAGHFLKQLFPTRNAKSLQQRFLEQTGREYLYTPPPVRKTNNSKPGQLSPANVAALKRVGVSTETFEFMGQQSRARVLGAAIAKDAKAYTRSREVAVSNLTAEELRAEFNRQMGWTK